MNRETLERTLRKTAGGSELISQAEIAKFLGYANPYRVGQEVCKGLPRFRRKYFVADVADRIMEMTETRK